MLHYAYTLFFFSLNGKLQEASQTAPTQFCEFLSEMSGASHEAERREVCDVLWRDGATHSQLLSFLHSVLLQGKKKVTWGRALLKSAAPHM